MKRLCVCGIDWLESSIKYGIIDGIFFSFIRREKWKRNERGMKEKWKRNGREMEEE